MPLGLRLVDGSVDWSGGVDSQKVPTLSSPSNPNGLDRNQLAWLINGTVRDGGISQRAGWPFLTKLITSGLWQGGYLYEPTGANPYLVCSISGKIYKALLEAPYTVTNLSIQFGLSNTATIEQAFFCQGEQFLVIQAGDYGLVNTPTLPLFWDGTALRRSLGINNPAIAPGTPGVNEIPAATCMVYFQGRLWWAQKRAVGAGDIVLGPSGTLPYLKRDSILEVTENPLVVGGDGFVVPSNAGNIRALAYTANLDVSLGQGPLYIFTRKQIYQLTVPVTRTDWISASSTNQPAMTVVQIVDGAVNEKCVVGVNGDLYFQSLEPGIRSLLTAIRYFQQPGNTQISSNENILIRANDRALLHAATGCQFDNRLLESALPFQTSQGIAHQAIVPLDFVPVSSFEKSSPPVWEGSHEGLDFFQLFSGDFGGLPRAFVVGPSKLDGSINIWELSQFELRDQNDHRIVTQATFPSFEFQKLILTKKLDTAELWFDEIYGTVDFVMEYRVDMDPCWYPWHRWQHCTARDSSEDATKPILYPLRKFCSSWKRFVLPVPQPQCSSSTNRPSNIGTQFQPRLTWKGTARLRGLWLYAFEVERQLYDMRVNC